MSKTIEEIKDQEACNDGYYRWGDVEERIISGDINVKQINHLIKQIAQSYAQSQTQELQEQNAELVEMLEYIFYKTNFQNHFPTTSIKVKNLLTKHNHLNKK